MKKELQEMVKKLGILVDLNLQEKEILPNEFYSWEEPKNYIDINNIKVGDRISGVYLMNYLGIKKPYWYKPYWSQFIVRKVEGELIYFSKPNGEVWSHLIEISTKDYFENCVLTLQDLLT